MKGKFWSNLRKCRVLHSFVASVFVATSFLSNGLNLVNAEENQSVPVKTVSFQSDDYKPDNSVSGSWHIDKSGEWTDIDKARITFDVNSVRTNFQSHKDVIMILDVSGSMTGGKISKVIKDTSNLLDILSEDNASRVSIIKFSTNSDFNNDILFNNDQFDEKGFVNVSQNLSKIKKCVNNLAALGNTNYYAPLVNAEKILNGYEDQNGQKIFSPYVKKDDTDLVMLFLTDGVPNQDVNLEVGQYRKLKENYPYMFINGIQYEMGCDMSQDIINISDKQWFSDMKTLSNVLINAVLEKKYDTYKVIDYVDLTYFDPITKDDIDVSFGAVTVDSPKNGKQKVTWNLDGMYIGSNEKMYINLKLKQNIDPKEKGDDFIYPTNTEEEVVYKIEKDDPEKKVTSTEKPKLKQFYRVRNFNNMPNTILSITDDKVTTPTEPDTTRVKRIFETVDRQPEDKEAPSLAGWIFKGWKIVTKDISILNRDYFVMPEQDVDIVGTWGKLGIKKSMEAEEVFEAEKPMLALGEQVNQIMRQLSGSNNNLNLTADKVKEIKFSDNLPTDSSYTKVDNLDYDADGKLTTPISSVLGIVNIAVEEKYGGGWESNIQNPVYMWYDATNEVINLKTPSGGVYLNENSGNMFNGYKNLSSVDLSKFDSSKVTEMYSIFANCSSLKSLDLSNFDTSNVVNIHGLFNGANSLETIKIGENVKFENITNSAGSIFNGCNNLKQEDIIAIVERMNFENITSTWTTFRNCEKLESIDLSYINTSSLKDAYNMFSGCINLKSLNLSSLDTSKLTDMSGVFYNCQNLESLNLSSLDTSKVTDMSVTFYNCKNLKTIYVSDKFVTNNVTRSGNMFYGCNNLVGGQGTVYDANNLDKTYARIDNTNNGKPGYFTDIKDKP